MILSRNSVILIFFSVLLSNTFGIALYTYFPLYLLNLETQKEIIQLIITILPLSSFLFPLFLGKISDNLQNRFKFIITGALGSSVTLLLFFFFNNLIIITFLLFSYGFFSACSSITFVLFAELVENDTKFISYYNAIIVLAWALGSQSCGIFIDYYGIQYIFVYLLTLSIINFVIVIFIKENRALILETNNKKENGLLSKETVGEFNNINPISNSIYYSLFFRNFGVRPIFSILAIIMGFYIASNFLIGFLTSMNFILQFFLIIIIGRIIANKNIKIILIIGYFLSTLAIFGYIFSTNFSNFLLSQIVFAFSYAMFNTSTQVYISQNTSPNNKGKYLSYANSSVFLGSFIGGLFFTLLLALYNNYYISMLFLLIFPIISAFIIILKFKIRVRINQNSKKDIIVGL